MARNLSKNMKRVAAGAMALAIVASNVTANVGPLGLLDNLLIANADGGDSDPVVGIEGVSVTFNSTEGLSGISYTGNYEQLITSFTNNKNGATLYLKVGTNGSWTLVDSAYALSNDALLAKDKGTYSVYGYLSGEGYGPVPSEFEEGTLLGTVTIGLDGEGTSGSPYLIKTFGDLTEYMTNDNYAGSYLYTDPNDSDQQYQQTTCLKLANDISYTGDYAFTKDAAIILDGHNITIDGNVVIGTKNEGDNVTYNRVNIIFAELNNADDAAKGIVKARSIYNYPKSKFDIVGATITLNGVGILRGSAHYCMVNGGLISLYYGGVINAGNDIYNETNGLFYMYDADSVFNGDIYNHNINNDQVVMYGGTINGFVHNFGAFKMTGGTITGTKDNEAKVYNQGTFTMTGGTFKELINGYNNTLTATSTISGGTVTGNITSNPTDTIVAGVTITGGEFGGDLISSSDGNDNKGTYTISGGTFAVDPSDDTHKVYCTIPATHGVKKVTTSDETTGDTTTVYRVLPIATIEGTPTAVTGLVYNGEELSLVNEMQSLDGPGINYAVTGRIETVKQTGEDNLSITSGSDIKVGAIYAIDAPDTVEQPTIYFPDDWSVSYGESYMDGTSSRAHFERKKDGNSYSYRVGAGNHAVELLNGYDAIQVTAVDESNKTFTVLPVKKNTLEGLAVDSQGDPLVWGPYATATEAGEYTILYKACGEDYVDSPVNYISNEIEKGTPTFTTVPAGDTTLKYTGSAESLLSTEGASTEGTTVMYAAVKDGRLPEIIKDNSSTTHSDIIVGDVLVPTGYTGIYLNYHKFSLDGGVVVNLTDNYIVDICFNSGKYFIYNWNNSDSHYSLKEGCDGVKVTAIDEEKGIIYLESIKSSECDPYADVEWSATAPKAKDEGTYNIWYYVDGGDNYNDTALVSVTSKISYRTAVLTLASSLGNVKVVDSDGNDVTLTENTVGEVTTKTATLEAMHTYKIYTEKTVLTDQENEYYLGKQTLKTNDANYDAGYRYVYTLELDALNPAEGETEETNTRLAYLLSHSSNWTGKVYSSDPTVLYVADGEVTAASRIKAATLKGNSVYYYGDKVDTSSVEIEGICSNILRVNRVYFTSLNGTEIDDISKVKYGKYLLRAEILVDNNENGKFDDVDIDLSYTVYKEVDYKARPMELNNYYLTNGEDSVPLDVKYAKQPEEGKEIDREHLEAEKTDDYTVPVVVVPDEYWVKEVHNQQSSESTKEYSVVKPEDTTGWTKKPTFVYNDYEQKPTIVVKNGADETIIVSDTAKEAVEADPEANPPVAAVAAVAQDYVQAVEGKTNAGNYAYVLEAVKTDNEYKGNYSDSVTVAWSIAKADSNGVTVAGTDIIYDGEAVDATDFTFTEDGVTYKAVAATPNYATADELTVTDIDGLTALDGKVVNPTTTGLPTITIEDTTIKYKLGDEPAVEPGILLLDSGKDYQMAIVDGEDENTKIVKFTEYTEELTGKYTFEAVGIDKLITGTREISTIDELRSLDGYYIDKDATLSIAELPDGSGHFQFAYFGYLASGGAWTIKGTGEAIRGTQNMSSAFSSDADKLYKIRVSDNYVYFDIVNAPATPSFGILNGVNDVTRTDDVGISFKKKTEAIEGIGAVTVNSAYTLGDEGRAYTVSSFKDKYINNNISFNAYVENPIGETENNGFRNVTVVCGENAYLLAGDNRQITYDNGTISFNAIVGEDSQLVTLDNTNGKVWKIAYVGIDDFISEADQGQVVLGQDLTLTLVQVEDTSSGYVAIDEAMDAGEYKAVFTIKNDNFNDYTTQEVDFEIKKRQVTLKVTDKQTAEYGDEVAPTITYEVETFDKEGRTGLYGLAAPAPAEVPATPGLLQAPAQGSDEEDADTKTYAESTYFGDVVKAGVKVKTTDILHNNRFDYDTFANDAGTYQYEIVEADAKEGTLENYEIVLDESSLPAKQEDDPATTDVNESLTPVAPANLFTVSPRKITSDMFVLNGTGDGGSTYTFTGSSILPDFTAVLDITHNSDAVNTGTADKPVYAPDDGYFGEDDANTADTDERIDKLEANDEDGKPQNYVVNGTLRATTPGSYKLEVKGTGNYTSTAEIPWTIAYSDEYFTTLKLEEFDENDSDSKWKDSDGFTYNGIAADEQDEYDFRITTETGRMVDKYGDSDKLGAVNLDTTNSESIEGKIVSGDLTFTKYAVVEQVANNGLTNVVFKKGTTENDMFAEPNQPNVVKYDSTTGALKYLRSDNSEIWKIGCAKDKVLMITGAQLDEQESMDESQPSIRTLTITVEEVDAQEYKEIDSKFARDNKFKTTVEYYKGAIADNNLTGDALETELDGLEKLDAAPVDAGEYTVVARTTAVGYSVATVYERFSIKPRKIYVDASATYEYGDVIATHNGVYGKNKVELIAYTLHTDSDEIAERDEDEILDPETGEIVVKGDLKLYKKTTDNDNTVYTPVNLEDLKDLDVGTYYLSDDENVKNQNYVPEQIGLYVGDHNTNYDVEVCYDSGEIEVIEKLLEDDNIIQDAEHAVKGEDGLAIPETAFTVEVTNNIGETRLVQPSVTVGEAEIVNYEVVSTTQTENSSQYEVQIHGVGNYTGYAKQIIDTKTEDQIDIADAEVETAKIILKSTGDTDVTKGIVKVTYTDEVSGETVELVEGTDFTIDGDLTTKTAGEKTLTLYGIGEYSCRKDVVVEVVELKAKVAAYQTYDQQGRVNMVVDFGYITDPSIEYGILSYRSEADNVVLTLDTDGVIKTVCDNTVTSLRTRDDGRYCYTRAYFKTGDDVIYGEQFMVRYDDVVAEEAEAGPHSEIVITKKYDEEGRIQCCTNFVYKGTEPVKYGVLTTRNSKYKDAELTIDIEDDSVANSEGPTVFTRFRMRDLGEGCIARTYMIIGEGENQQVVYGDQIVVNYADL